MGCDGIVWGSTLLDRSVSDLYDNGRGRVLSVPRRGIGDMLQRVAEGLIRPPT